MVAQCLGAIAAAMTASGVDVIATIPERKSESARVVGDFERRSGMPRGVVQLAYGPVFLHELVGTFVLVSTVLTAAVAKPGLGDAAPFAIGLAVFVCIGSCGKLTGGFFNPARFLGPALVFGCNFNITWLYWTAHFMGGAMAGVTHRFVLEPRKRDRPLLSTNREANDVELSNAPAPALFR